MADHTTTPGPRLLAGHSVHPLGLGCMGMSEFYGPSDDAESLTTLNAACDLGVQHFDSADTYGFGHNEELLGRFLRSLAPSQRDTLVVATKFGIVRQRGQYQRRIDNSPAYIRQACEASLRRLGVERIGLYYCHRRDAQVPLAEMVGALADLVREGKIAAIGLSEVSADSLRAAHAVHPIAAVQSEYSLWERGAEAEVLPAALSLGVAFVAYSPLGRSFLTDQPPAAQDLAADDFRRALPRLQGDAGAANQRLQQSVAAIAGRLDQPTAAVALAWLLQRQPHVLPIPGTRRAGHLRQNLAACHLVLPDAVLAELDHVFRAGQVAGARYPDAGWAGVETR
ncbi:aldo/keto reductase [Pseudorhodoferax sp. Leaf267]|uniref:aldo/keto reductase n=1 Tax=Pseudorhodoferax sp. Leaf267 TaxID=1736316 RepID=UPI0006FFEC07|nr:aldo/keto reductase [Pseudorhodoferax sp. Leaf267]KQP17899.1 aldo/keto reductase [Pseudorhodoferax sp. Leaf267]